MKRVDEIAARIGAVGPMPWRASLTPGRDSWIIDGEGRNVTLFPNIGLDAPQDMTNFNVLLHAPADLAWTVARIRRLEEALKAAKQIHLLARCEDPRVKNPECTCGAIAQHAAIDAVLNEDP